MGQFWKVPVIWGIIGASSYFTYSNYLKYQAYRAMYILSLRDTSYYGQVNSLLLYENTMHYRRLLETGIILTSAFYILNIIDAYVSAHLRSFKELKEEEFALKIGPDYALFGLRLYIN